MTSDKKLVFYTIWFPSQTRIMDFLPKSHGGCDSYIKANQNLYDRHQSRAHLIPKQSYLLHPIFIQSCTLANIKHLIASAADIVTVFE